MSGKGDKRRPGKPGAFEEGYNAINWGPRKETPKKKSFEEALLEDYVKREAWFIPDIEEIFKKTWQDSE